MLLMLSLPVRVLTPLPQLTRVELPLLIFAYYNEYWTDANKALPDANRTCPNTELPISHYRLKYGPQA